MLASAHSAAKPRSNCGESWYRYTNYILLLLITIHFLSAAFLEIAPFINSRTNGDIYTYINAEPFGITWNVIQCFWWFIAEAFPCNFIFIKIRPQPELMSKGHIRSELFFATLRKSAFRKILCSTTKPHCNFVTNSTTSLVIYIVHFSDYLVILYSYVN